jgi:hypothetical protein
MDREIRHRDGTRQIVFAGPNTRPWWRRHLGALACIGLFAVVVVLTHLGGR